MPRTQTLINSPRNDGSIMAVNRRRLNEMPYFLLTNPPQNQVAVPANQSSPMQICMVSGKGPAAIVSLGHQKTAPMRVFFQIQDGQMQRGLMNGAVHIDTIMGTGAQPYPLAEALYIDELRTLQVVFTDISGAANAVRMSALATRYLDIQPDPNLVRVRRRMDERQYLSVPYWYTLDRATTLGGVTVGAGATVQETITVGQDHHFQIFQMSAVSTGLFNINIVDTQRGESLISAPQDTNYAIGSELILGNGNFPFRFHEPRTIQSRQRLLVTLTDRTGAPNLIHLTLHGRALATRMWR